MTCPVRIAVPEPTSQDRRYNRRAWKEFEDAIERAGGLAIKIELDRSQAELAKAMSECSGVLLPGSPADVDPQRYGEERERGCGAKDPAREAADELLLQDAFNLRKPILGVCYGMQSLAVWRNGSLIQDLPKPATSGLIDHSPGRDAVTAHIVTLEPDCGLAGLVLGAADVQSGGSLIRIPVNSSHHQAIKVSGDRLRVVAKADDGVIEALEGIDPGQFVLAVQWHPERTFEESAASQHIFQAFVNAAAAWHARPIEDSRASGLGPPHSG